MGTNSKIEWTDHTFNPWIGCTRVSPACEHCYAESMANHYRWATWGTANSGGTRRVTSDANWHKPLAWNREASIRGERHRVFCASLSDVFEGFDGLDVHRARLWKLIGETGALDWLLLTKRPENVRAMAPWNDEWPENVWLGTTVEDQRRAEERITHLVEHPAVVRFLSVEPLLGPLDLRPWLGAIDWVILGGESGPGSRPMQIEWARSVRDQCIEFDVPFFFKQWGNNVPDASGNLVRLRTKNERLLDGRTWDTLPVPVRRRAA